MECQHSATKGEDYAGRVSTTASGLTCKPWSSTKYASLGDHAFCRNPSSHSGGVWCYTTDASKSWDICDLPVCEEGETNFSKAFPNSASSPSAPYSGRNTKAVLGTFRFDELDFCASICDFVTFQSNPKSNLFIYQARESSLVPAGILKAWFLQKL